MRVAPFIGAWLCLASVLVPAVQGQSCGEARSTKDRFTALLVCVQEDRKAAVGQILYELGAPFAAAEWVTPTPLAWRADQAAKRVRWSRLQLTRDPSQRYENADLALIQIQQLLEEIQKKTPIDRPMERRLRFDRVSALHSRGKCREVVEELKILETENPLPAYVQLELGDCLAELRQPEEARKRYTEVLKLDPKNRQARMGYAYAALDMEDAQTAYKFVDAIAAENPAPFAVRRPNAGPEASGEWLDGKIAGAIFRLYAEQPAEADQRLRSVINGAPGLAYLRADSGKIAAARGKPRWADQELHIAAGIAPEDFGIQVELANSALRRRRYAEAETRYKNLVAQNPEDGAVKRLGRDLATEKTYLLETYLSVTDEDGSTDASPGSNLTTGLKLYTPPFAERWRVIGATSRQTAKPIEGKVDRNRFGGGLNYRAPDVTIEAMGWSNTGTVDAGGADIWGYWEVSDAWRLNASFDYFSDDVPLRALFYNTRGNSVGAAVDFQPNESQSLQLSIKSINFTDSNERLVARLAGSQNLLQRPGLSVTLQPELYGSRNTETDVPYFSPEQDGAAQIAVDLNQRLWRKYKQVFSHSINIGAGVYDQRNVSTDWIGNARYGQSFRIDPLTELTWSIDVNRRIYDGDAVHNLTGSLGWTQRF